jgi:hypothetical protein
MGPEGSEIVFPRTGPDLRADLYRPVRNRGGVLLFTTVEAPAHLGTNLQNFKNPLARFLRGLKAFESRSFADLVS